MNPVHFGHTFIMSSTYLVRRQVGSSYLFRSVIPLDLQPQLGRRQFQLSLRYGILKQAKFLSLHLHHLTPHLASKLGITVSTLQKHLQHLTNLNLIDKQKGHDTGYYCYRLIAS